MEKRLALMEEGLNDLEQLLKDLLRQGLSSARNRSLSYWEERAARLVDAKLPALARRVRRFPFLLTSGPDWPDAMLEEIAQLFLFVRGFRKRESLPEALQHDLKAGLGAYHKKDEVLADPANACKDQWEVMGLVEGKEENLRFRRCWLRGQNSRRFALLLDFVFGNEDFQEGWKEGEWFEGTVCFYPSAFPLRGIFPERVPMTALPVDDQTGFTDLDALQDAYSDALSKNPWLFLFPAYLNRLTAAVKGGEVVLLDANHRKLSLGLDIRKKQRLLALSGGRPIGVFGEWTGARLEALSALVDTASGRLPL